MSNGQKSRSWIISRVREYTQYGNSQVADGTANLKPLQRAILQYT